MPKDRRRRRRLLGEGGISLLLHLLVLALLVLTVTPRRHEDIIPSSEVAVVFEGGHEPEKRQTPDSRRSSPTVPPDKTATEETSPGQTPSRPAQTAAPPVQQQQQATPKASPAPPSPQVERGSSELALPPSSTSRAPPRPNRPVARPALPRAATQDNPFASLSAPMNFSLAGRPPPPASEGRLKRGINLTMAPTEQNRNVMTRYAEGRHKLGEDWWAAFSAYVEAHKYYPLAAAQNGEDGQVVLNLVIERNGTVHSVSIAQNLASPQLGNAWVSEFRGKTDLPPFPPGTVESEVSFPASMNYILLHE